MLFGSERSGRVNRFDQSVLLDRFGRQGQDNRFNWVAFVKSSRPVPSGWKGRVGRTDLVGLFGLVRSVKPRWSGYGRSGKVLLRVTICKIENGFPQKGSGY